MTTESSPSPTAADASTPATSDDELTDDEQAVFERLAEKYEDSDVGRICEAVLQSSADGNEEANS